MDAQSSCRRCCLLLCGRRRAGRLHGRDAGEPFVRPEDGISIQETGPSSGGAEHPHDIEAPADPSPAAAPRAEAAGKEPLLPVDGLACGSTNGASASTHSPPSEPSHSSPSEPSSDGAAGGEQRGGSFIAPLRQDLHEDGDTTKAPGDVTPSAWYASQASGQGSPRAGADDAEGTPAQSWRKRTFSALTNWYLDGKSHPDNSTTQTRTHRVSTDDSAGASSEASAAAGSSPAR